MLVLTTRTACGNLTFGAPCRTWAADVKRANANPDIEVNFANGVCADVQKCLLILYDLIFLHGLGDTGRGWSEALRPIVPPHCKIVCPNAKPISIVINNRAVMPAWYDIYGMSPDAPQDESGIRLAATEVAKLVQAEVEGGIPEHRIILGGFSQGGGLALYYGLTSGSKLGGIVTLSSWLPLHRSIMKNQSRIKAPTDLPILQCHGLSDQLIPSVIGDLTHRFLLDFQMSKCSLRKFPGLGHAYNEEELKAVQEFLCETLST